ncbi:CLUMA_CG011858, isoform B [Clunio marinus]|nr:CLUMA_CG011858, isoform B [Clunio marinus]
MAYLTPESETSTTADLSWSNLISTDKPRNIIVRIDDIPKEINPEEEQLNAPDNFHRNHRERKESLMGTFHRHLRMSLKAVSESPGPLTRYRQTRFSSRRVRKRVIFKHGDVNVVQGKVSKRRRRYLQDIFTTLVDIQWRWTILIFALNFMLSWFFLALLWYAIAVAHGDIEYFDLMSKSSNAEEFESKSNHTPCVTEIKSFLSAFLFSLETQHTIGYGHRYITEECPEAAFVLCLQSITGVFFQAFMVGTVFAKLSRPKKRAQTLLFSRNAIICHRDGVPCLMFRVGDMRKSHIIEAHVRAQIIRKKVTKEGELLPFFQEELAVGADGSDDRLMFIWPTLIVHKIDENSPLYDLTAQDMIKDRFEIVTMLEGVVESTGMTTQARSSYLPSEILWGHRFESVVQFKRETGEYEVDYTLFNNTYEVDTPLCSARQLNEARAETQLQQGEIDQFNPAFNIHPIPASISLETPKDSDNTNDFNLPNGELPNQSQTSSSSSTTLPISPDEKKPLTQIVIPKQKSKNDGNLSSLDNVISNLPLTIVPSIAKNLSSQASENLRNRTLRPGTAKKYRKRAILKNGECNIVQSKLSQKRLRFLQDIFTTFVDTQWRWTLLTFGLSFILSWLFFAVIWWLIAFTHGDFEESHLPDNQADSGWSPCVYNIHSFTSCFLFSIETQHTIGYGVRTTTEECPEAIFIMCFQSIYGVMIQAFMVGIVFAKMTRPKHRTQTLLFSKYAVICQRDGELTLMFRVGDMRKSHIIGANVRAQLIKTKLTREGEIIGQYQTELDIGTDGCSSDLFFIWPMVVCHKINATSPLYNMSASDLLQQERFEIVVILEGTVESTGQTTQARSSYLACEILWGHRFEPVVTYNREKQGYEIDYSKFNAAQQVDTPLCSARELTDYYKLQDELKTPVDVKFSIGPKNE